jgi:hypothetical protein
MSIAAAQCAQFSELIPPRPDVYTLVSQDNGTYYILTNMDAVNYKVMSANESTVGSPNEWTTLIAEQPQAYLLQVRVYVYVGSWVCVRARGCALWMCMHACVCVCVCVCWRVLLRVCVRVAVFFCACVQVRVHFCRSRSTGTC